MMDEPVEQIVNLFLWAFQPQWKFGRQAVKRSLLQVMAEKKLSAAQMAERIAEWGQQREDMPPWKLAEKPPRQVAWYTAPPGPPKLLDPATLPPVDPKVLARVRTILAPYDEEDI